MVSVHTPTGLSIVFNLNKSKSTEVVLFVLHVNIRWAIVIYLYIDQRRCEINHLRKWKCLSSIKWLSTYTKKIITKSTHNAFHVTYLSIYKEVYGVYVHGQPLFDPQKPTFYGLLISFQHKFYICFFKRCLCLFIWKSLHFKSLKISIYVIPHVKSISIYNLYKHKICSVCTSIHIKHP